MTHRYGIRLLLVACALVAGFFPFRGFYNHWFRSSYSDYHVHKVLGDYVSNGDSLDYVLSLFDRSESRSKSWVDKNGPIMANHKSIFADHKSGDEYYLFFINGSTTHALFQFRNDVVVNHLNGMYNNPYSSVPHYKDRSPNSLLRHGALTVYAIAVAVCGTVVLLTLKAVTLEKTSPR